MKELFKNCLRVEERDGWLVPSRFPKFDKIHSRHIIVENLMAVREASILSELSSKDVEDIFYNNACNIFDVVG